ncbi:MAG: hypothetical protein H6586_00350 [Flavobacteriales bacterium]|nr:hypothetical protein [Flavobacteriales bacterium]
MIDSDNKMLEPLTKIEKVNPSPFLFSKIEQRIKEEAINYISNKWLVAASISLIILFAGNSFLLNKEIGSKTKNEINLIEAFQLNTNNQLYNE